MRLKLGFRRMRLTSARNRGEGDAADRAGYGADAGAAGGRSKRGAVAAAARGEHPRMAQLVAARRRWQLSLAALPLDRRMAGRRALGRGLAGHRPACRYPRAGLRLCAADGRSGAAVGHRRRAAGRGAGRAFGRGEQAARRRSQGGVQPPRGVAGAAIRHGRGQRTGRLRRHRRLYRHGCRCGAHARPARRGPGGDRAL